MLGFIYKVTRKEYNIDKATVKGILVRQKAKLRDFRLIKFNRETKQAMLDEYNKGVSRKEIMQKYHISKAYLSQLISGKRRI